MSMWPRNKPLSQPPHFRTGEHTMPPADLAVINAQRALECSKFERGHVMSKSKSAPMPRTREVV